MKTLFINPNIIAVENIDDPPRLRSGKGIPVKGIKPRIVNKFINICTPRRINNPERRYFSNSIWVSLIILFTLKKNRTHKDRSRKPPRKPKFLEKREKIKSVVCTGTNTSVTCELVI